MDDYQCEQQQPALEISYSSSCGWRWCWTFSAVCGQLVLVVFCSFGQVGKRNCHAGRAVVQLRRGARRVVGARAVVVKTDFSLKI